MRAAGRTIAAAVAAAAMIATPARAGAERDAAPDRVEIAKRLAASAQVHFDLGEYDEAILDYREAYRLHPSPGILYNLGQAYRLKGDCVTASTMYRNYLRLAPDSPYRSLVQDHLDELAGCDRDQLAAGGQAQLELDAQARLSGERTPPPGHRATLAGEHAVAELDGMPADAPPQPGRRRRVAGLAIAGVGALVSVAGMAYAIDASRAAGDVTEAYELGRPWEEIETLDARGRRSEVVGASLLVVGTGALITGATLYYLGWRADERAKLSLMPGRRGASVAVSWRF